MPDGTRKYIRAKTQKELDDKVLQVQILVKPGVDMSTYLMALWLFSQRKGFL